MKREYLESKKKKKAESRKQKIKTMREKENPVVCESMTCCYRNSLFYFCVAQETKKAKKVRFAL